MSKNKLNTEEQAFQDKINEAHFSYNESAWLGVKGQLNGPPNTVTFNPLLKAAAGFLIITSLVFVMQNQYSASTDTNTEVVSTEKTVDKAEAIQKEKTTPNNNVAEVQKESTEVIPLVKETQKVERHNSKTQTAEKSNDSYQKEKQEEMANVSPKIEKEIILTPTDKLNANIQLIGKSCLNQTITLKAKLSEWGTDYRYQWKVNAVKLNDSNKEVAIELDKAGKYTIDLSVLNKNGEKLASSHTDFTVENAVQLDFTYEDQTGILNDYVAVFDVKSSVNNLSWEINGKPVALDQKNAYNFSREGIFDVELIHQSEMGCRSAINKPVLISSDFKPLVNAFTPNGDGTNDYFMPDGFANFDGTFILRVYSIDGILVFESSSQSEPWNGKFNNKGSMLPDGNYIWKIEVRKGEQQRFFSDRVKLLTL